jgi:choice-of-anchor A domain-containing protein
LLLSVAISGDFILGSSRRFTTLDGGIMTKRYVSLIVPIVAMALSASVAFAGTPLGPNAQLFGVLAVGSISLPGSTTVSAINRGAPEVGAETAQLNGLTSTIAGDLITSATTGVAISLAGAYAVRGKCVSAGGSIPTPIEAKCLGGLDSSGTSPLLSTLSDAQGEVVSYSSYLAALTPTITLGDITLKKYQHLTIKLNAGVNVISIGNITTAGVNNISFSAPKGAVAVVNVTGALDLGASSQVFANSNSVSPENLIWNIESPNPTFGKGVVFSGTVINVADDTTVDFGSSSVVTGAVLTSGSIVAHAAIHVNFWPFTAAP